MDSQEPKKITPQSLDELLAAFPKEAREQFESQKEFLKSVFSFAYVGEHVLRFILQCRKHGTDPYTVFNTVKAISESKPELKIRADELPIICFLEWLATPNEDNFQKMSKALCVDFDEHLKMESGIQSKEMVKEAETQPELPKNRGLYILTDDENE